jgi:hypothetical protein
MICHCEEKGDEAAKRPRSGDCSGQKNTTLATLAPHDLPSKSSAGVT